MGNECDDFAKFLSTGIVTLSIVFGSILLHILLPAVEVEGYACKDDVGDGLGGSSPIKYRLNGVLCLVVVVSIWFSLEFGSDFDTSISMKYAWWTILWSNIIGLSLTAYVLLTTEPESGVRCLTRDQLEVIDGKTQGTTEALKRNGGSAPATFGARLFFGHQFNVAFAYNRADAKMALYLVGAILLEWNVLSLVKLGGASNALLLYASLFSWFILEYMCGEVVHLYTYDLFAERVGFKLIWGCCAFYPCFYCVGGFALTNSEQDISIEASIITGLVFFCGWLLTRGANLQKFFFKVYGHKTFLCLKNETIEGTKLLISGFWGMSRHINYAGEIIQAIALSIPSACVGAPVGYVLLAWAYPLYYILLFVPRQIDDDKLCSAKYAASWEEYRRLVPYRIFPGVW